MRIARPFLSGPHSMLFLVAAAVVGVVALVLTPQEEEPQIVVPMADVFVSYPGRSPAEVEEQVTRPLERLLWQVSGVEHVYSISRRDQSVVTVRFFVGQDRERSIVNLRDQIDSHRDLVPPGVTGWVVKPVQIDDVPVLSLTFHSGQRDAYQLRRIAEEAKARIDSLDDISGSEIFGGLAREITVEPDIEALASRGVCLADLQRALQGGEPGGDAGAVLSNGRVLGPAPRARDRPGLPPRPCLDPPKRRTPVPVSENAYLPPAAAPHGSSDCLSQCGAESGAHPPGAPRSPKPPRPLVYTRLLFFRYRISSPATRIFFRAKQANASLPKTRRAVNHHPPVFPPRRLPVCPSPQNGTPRCVLPPPWHGFLTLPRLRSQVSPFLLPFPGPAQKRFRGDG